MKAEETGPQSDRYITIFRRNEDGRYVRTDEHHVLRLYVPDEVVGLLRQAGLEAEVRDDYPGVPADLPPIPGWKVILARRPIAPIQSVSSQGS